MLKFSPIELHICLVRIVAYGSMSMPFEMTITDVPFVEEAWRHVPCAICNYLGWPEHEVHGKWLTCKSVRRWAYFS